MDRVLGLLGLAKKAGSLQIGEEPVSTTAQAGRARVILLASDTAGNSRSRAEKLAALHDTPLLTLPYDKMTLGGAVGRGGCAMLAMTDVRMALSLVRAMGLAEDDPITVDLIARSQRVEARRAEERALKRRAGRT